MNRKNGAKFSSAHLTLGTFWGGLAFVHMINHRSFVIDRAENENHSIRFSLFRSLCWFFSALTNPCYELWLLLIVSYDVFWQITRYIQLSKRNLKGSSSDTVISRFTELRSGFNPTYIFLVTDAVSKIHRTQGTWEKGNDARADSLWLLQVGDSPNESTTIWEKRHYFCVQV